MYIVFLILDIIIVTGNLKNKIDSVERIYPIELELKDTTDTVNCVSYLDLHLEIDNQGRMNTILYDKRDDFSFLIVNFPFLCSNIPIVPAYGIHISKLILYSRT